MTLITQNAKVGASEPDEPAPLQTIARQPILDASGNLFGYELLFRSGSENRFFADGNSATRTVLDSTLIFSLEQLSGGYNIFVNCSRESLLNNLVQVLNPEKAVLEILEGLVVNEPLIAACRDLRAKGYRLALDDYDPSPAMAQLIELADFIKIDVLAVPVEERRRIMAAKGPTRAMFIAERVETPEMFESLKAEGFHLFQGYYFCRPVQCAVCRTPSNLALYLELLRLVQRTPIDIRDAVRLLRRDALITYRLLRLVNSPIYAMQREIRSIEQAMMVIGDDMFRRMVFLAIGDASAGAKPSAVLQLALQRGRFCEVMAKRWQLDPDEQCLLGLVSLLPAILKVKMDTIVELLPVSPAFRQALLGVRVKERGPLSWMECFESGDWEGCAAIEAQSGVDESEMVAPYAEAIRWADETGNPR
jgi:EAL and modified HD-GYP domain-containing signal transduction protein